MATSDLKRPPWETSPWRTFQEEPSVAPPSVGSMLGAIAIAVGVGVLGAYMLDMHSHTCEACGHRWRHLGAFNLGDPRAHTCQGCGTVQWWKDGIPHVFRASIREAPAKAVSTSLVGRSRALHESTQGAQDAWFRGSK